MEYDEYTQNNICRKLGLHAFNVGPDLEECSAAVRLLYCPSFHSEICITLSLNDSCSVEIRIPAEHLWNVPTSTIVPIIVDKVSIARFDFDKFLRTAREVSDQVVSNDRFVVVDGMKLEGVIVQKHERKLFEQNVGAGGPVADFGAEVLKYVYQAVSDTSAKNAIADAASYVGLKLAKHEIKESIRPNKIGILGTPEQREEYFHFVQSEISTKASKSDPKSS